MLWPHCSTVVSRLLYKNYDPLIFYFISAIMRSHVCIVGLPYKKKTKNRHAEDETQMSHLHNVDWFHTQHKLERDVPSWRSVNNNIPQLASVRGGIKNHLDVFSDWPVDLDIVDDIGQRRPLLSETPIWFDLYLKQNKQQQITPLAYCTLTWQHQQQHCVMVKW